MQEMTFKQLIFIALIPLLSIPVIIVLLKLYQALVSKSVGTMDRLSAKVHERVRELKEREIAHPRKTEIEIDFVPESFFENIKTDKLRPRKEWIGMIMVFNHNISPFATIHQLVNHNIFIYVICFVSPSS
jgi:hypothetical protein